MAVTLSQKMSNSKTDKYTAVPLSDQTKISSLLSGLSFPDYSIKSDTESSEEAKRNAVSAGQDEGLLSGKLPSVPTRMSCNCCSVVFENRHDQKQHFRSDWHRYNLKQKLKGYGFISEEQFESMTDDLSSISGSDDSSSSMSEDESNVAKDSASRSHVKKSHAYDSSDSCESDSKSGNIASVMAATKRDPKVFLKNGDGQVLSLYRCILYHRKNAPSTPEQLLSMVKEAQEFKRVAVIMLAGGHFSAALFDGTEAVLHKTFHRYVVRAKRGTIQSVRDNKGSAPKSGGASLRRYNEAALALEIQELLKSWSQQLEACHLIFLRISTYSRQILFGGKSPVFSKDDQRVRTIPFNTGRPTFNEAQRVHRMLMTVHCHGTEYNFICWSAAQSFHSEAGHFLLNRTGAQNLRERTARGDAISLQKGDKAIESAMQQINTICPKAEDPVSEGEIVLVHSTVQIQTGHLQEFECSVDGRKEAKKKKDKRKKVKKVGQKTAEKETAEPEATHADGAGLGSVVDEEEEEVKNQMYTCCRSGDVVRLGLLLGRLGIDTCLSDTEGSIGENSHNTSTNKVEAQQPENSGPSSSDQCCGRTESVYGSDLQGTPVSRAALASNFHPGSHVSDSKIPQKTAFIGVNSNRPGVLKSDRVVEEGSQSDISFLDSNEKVQLMFSSIVLGKYGQKRASLLHVCAEAGHADIVTTLLQAGCDPALRDVGGKTAYSVAATKDTRNAFRRYRGSHPDRYDYEAAQIPEALTAEKEAEKKQKESEKKKAQRKARQERLKEQKTAEHKAMEEKREKERFLALTDREKRALAAERRFVAQCSPQAHPVLNRCYQCATDITGKVPFEYMDFKFCTPKCLQEHRIKNVK